VAEALKDADPARRAAAALVLGRSGTAEQRAAVQALLADPSPLVRFRAAQGLLGARERAALPALAALAGEAPWPVAVRADELLACVAGPHAPRLFGTDAAARRRARAAWDAWVRRHGAADLAHGAVDLSPANPALRAGAAARRLVLSLLRDEREACRDASEAPFLVGGEQLLNTRGDLDNFLPQFAQGLRNQSSGTPVVWTRFGEAAPRAASPTERTFLARFRKGEVYPVELFWQGPERGGEVQNLTLLVRLAGERPRVVALDPKHLVVPSP
jgi:hypothetical protein